MSDFSTCRAGAMQLCGPYTVKVLKGVSLSGVGVHSSMSIKGGTIKVSEGGMVFLPDRVILKVGIKDPYVFTLEYRQLESVRKGVRGTVLWPSCSGEQRYCYRGVSLCEPLN